MVTYFKKYPYLLLLVLAVIWQSLIIYFLQLNHQDLIFLDSEDYLRAAKKFFSFRGAHYHRPIGMSFISGIPLIFNASDSFIYNWSWILNLISWLLTIFLVFKITSKIVSHNLAFVLSVIYLLCAGSAIITMHLLSETYYVFALVLSIYFLQKYKLDKTVKYLFFAIFIIANSILIRPVSIYILALLLILHIKPIYKNLKVRSARWMYFGFFIVIMQCLAMLIQYGNFKVSYIDSATLYYYISCKADAKNQNAEYKQVNSERAEIFERLSYPEQDKLAKKDFVNQLTNNTGNLFSSLFENIIENASTHSFTLGSINNVKDRDSFIVAKRFFRWLSKWQNILFTLIAVFLIVYLAIKVVVFKKMNIFSLKFELFLGLTIAYLILASGISFGQGDRFHIVIFPTVLILLVVLFRRKRIA